MHLHTQLKVSMITWNKIISGGGRAEAGIGHGGGSMLKEGWRARGAGAASMARVAEVLGTGRIGYPAHRAGLFRRAWSQGAARMGRSGGAL